MIDWQVERMLSVVNALSHSLRTMKTLENAVVLYSWYNVGNLLVVSGVRTTIKAQTVKATGITTAKYFRYTGELARVPTVTASMTRKCKSIRFHRHHHRYHHHQLIAVSVHGNGYYKMCTEYFGMVCKHRTTALLSNTLMIQFNCIHQYC